MKNANSIKRLFFLIALAASSLTFGQGLKSEISFSKYRSQDVVDVVCEGHFTYLLYRGTSNLLDHWIVKTDSSGNILFEVPYTLPNTERYSNLRMIANDQNLYVSGRAFESCDVNECTSFVTKLNLLGIHQLQINLETDICSGGNKEPLNTGPNGEIIIGLERLNDTKVYVYSSLGTLLDSIIIPINNPIWVDLNANGTLSYASTQSLHILNATGSISFSHSPPLPIREVLYENNHYIVAALDTVYILNDSLILLDKVYFSGYSDFRKLKKMGLEFQVLASMGNVKHVLTFDQNQVIRDLTLPIGVVSDPHIFDHSPSVYCLAITNSNIVSGTVRQLIYSLLHTNSISVSRPDIGIVNQELLQSHTWPHGVTQDIYGLSANIRVLVKNYSSHTVDSFKVNSSNYAIGGVCTQYFVSERFHQTILPGDSAWIELPTLYFDYFYSPSGAPLNKLICTSTSDPNGIADTNSSNNQSCMTHLMGYVGVQESDVKSILLYPNPGRETIKVVHDLGVNLNYHILNIQGQIVQKGEIDADSIDIGTLPSGLYFIQFYDEHQLLSTQKWVKQ